MRVLLPPFERRHGRPLGSYAEVAVAVSRIPYGRPSTPTPAAVVDEWRGTCSTKHILLRALLREGWPEVGVRLWHRPYRVTPELARQRWGEAVAEALPDGGLFDVHTYATVETPSGLAVVDVTFPVETWDGRSDLPLACGEGEDYEAGEDVLADKQALVDEWCDPALREPFIAALTRAAARP